jgi:hypothetical protein
MGRNNEHMLPRNKIITLTPLSILAVDTLADLSDTYKMGEELISHRKINNKKNKKQFGE